MSNTGAGNNFTQGGAGYTQPTGGAGAGGGSWDFDFFGADSLDWTEALTAVTQIGSLAVQYDAAQDAEELQEQRLEQQKKLRNQRKKEIEKQERRLERKRQDREDELSQRSLALMQNREGENMLTGGPKTGQEDDEDTLG